MRNIYFEKQAKTEISKALGSFAQYAVADNAIVKLIADRLEGKKTVNKEFIERVVAKKNKDLAIAIEAGDVLQAAKAVKMEHESEVVLAAREEQAMQVEFNGVGSKADEVSYAHAEVEKQEAVVATLVAAALLAQTEEPVSVNPMFAERQAMIEAGVVKHAPMEAMEYKATMQSLKENKFQGITLDVAAMKKKQEVAAAFAETRNEAVTPARVVSMMAPKVASKQKPSYAFAA